jgi:antitoxin ParD1/3/4
LRRLRITDSAYLAKICHRRYAPGMSSMNISLPDALKSYMDEQVVSRRFGTSSAYVRDLIRGDQDRQRLSEFRGQYT